MASFEFRDPLFLLTGLIAPVVFVLAARSRGRLVYSTLSVVEAAGGSSWRARLANAPAAMLALAAVLIAIALAGPRTGDATTEVFREGIAIALVVDRSGSMEARDFVEDDTSVSRLEAVKEIVRDFVLGGDDLEGRSDDLVGLVAFARYADGLCPLTLDHENLAAILDDVEIVEDRNEDGTAIGEGLALAVERLRRLEGPSKVAILLSDGVNNAGEILPRVAADLAARNDVRLYAIGAGRTGMAPFPIRSGGRVGLRRQRVQLDERTLRDVAVRTGGRYFHASTADALRDVYAEIDRLERSEIREVRYLQYTEHYAGFAAAALGCLLVAAVGAASVFRRLP